MMFWIVVLQMIASVLIGMGLIQACRWVRRRDRVAGAIVQAGVLLRLLCGLALFWTSYLNLPILRGLHSGDGFWEPDARSYFAAASAAMQGGLGSVGDWSASPSFVKALALWMHVVGVSPASGLYLNLVAYVASIVLVMLASGRESGRAERTGRLLILGCLTFSPALVLFGSEPLKDQFFSLCVVTSSVAAMMWLTPVAFGTLRDRARVIAFGLAAMCASVYLIAGIRPYVSFLFIAAMAVVLAVYVWRQPRRRLAAYILASVVALGLLWASFARGAGAYYPYYESKVLAVVGIEPGQRVVAAGAIDSARDGFVQSGGGTNLVRRSSLRKDARWLERQIDRVEALAFGLAAVTIPVSVLEWLSLVNLSGGHGLLFLIDADTVFFDLSCAAVILFLIRERRRITGAGVPYVMYAATAAVVMTLLMAYVVTNLGTLFRLRLIPATLVWLLPLALAIRHSAVAESLAAAPRPGRARDDEAASNADPEPELQVSS